MKPIIGLIRIRAKAGMTIPAAPKMTRASLKPDVPNSPSTPPLKQGGSALSPRE
jgi:hypothetical protein